VGNKNVFLNFNPFMGEVRMKLAKSQSGFSLVELMVVVAIIGILATISVGAIQKQIAKSRQSEAKTNLSTLYGAEKAFLAEFQTYVASFNVMKLAYEGTLRYNVGFTGGTAEPAIAALNGLGYQGPAPTGVMNSSAFCVSLAVTGCVPGPNAAAGPFAATVGLAVANPSPLVAPTAAVFRAGAAANNLYKVNGDQWTIDQNKTLVNSLDSIGGTN
jgi:type IV pilus assembly protein PilA